MFKNLNLMKIFKESKQKHLYFSAAFAFALSLSATSVYANPGGNHATSVQSVQQNGNHKVTGKVVDSTGEPLIGATVMVEGSTNGTVTDIDGNFVLNTTPNAKLVFSYVGYTAQTIPVAGKSTIDVSMKEETNTMNEVVVTAMGIMRKEKSLTYATQQVKAEDLMKVQDPNAANSLEGKVAGITITPSAGGAGGASKIVLRGNRSILGNSSPLIVVDGVPMSNGIRGQQGMSGEGFGSTGMSEGSDPLSLINPDDIESINVLKGANAAALYGSRAANGVVMITTKRGREGKVDINVTSNITFDSPLLTPKIQKTYGSTYDPATGALSLNNWGGKVADRADNDLIVRSPLDDRWVGYEPEQIGTDALDVAIMARRHDVHLRNRTVNDVDNFFRTGVTTNNSLSLSGGTETARTYVSVANSHATGMMRNNSYNRNSISFRQTYNFFKRLHIDASMSYTETKTRNRPGGGTVGNPLYHLYTAPQNLDMNYYRDHYVNAEGKWLSNPASYYKLNGSNFSWAAGQRTTLTGPQQEWAFLSHPNNNPYWLLNMGNSQQNESRLFGTLQANVDIYDGLTFQARVNYSQLRFKNHATRYATTFLPASMEDYGRLWDSDEKTTEFYTDYLLSYNKTFGDYSVSATAGFVGHTIKGETKGTDAVATYYDRLMRKLPTMVNYFETSAGGYGVTNTSKSSNWDRSYLFTAQLGWKETIYFDASYRRDWYRPFRYFKLSGISDTDNYGYFGVGANAIVTKLVKLPEVLNYLKYRASYSEVGNSIPNFAYDAVTENLQTGAIIGSNYSQFVDPRPEKTRSFETGIESLWFNNRLSFDLTYYNAIMSNLYMTVGSGTGLTKNLNSAKVRNQGIEMTIGYDFKPFSWLRWRTSYNLSYNNNKILKTAYDEQGKEREIEQVVAGVHVKYKEGGSIGDMYVPDYDRDANGHIKLNTLGQPQFDKSGKLVYAGNMNGNWQMGWSNTFTWKEFNLSFLINGRIGGKVISLTEQKLDYYGFSERTANARLNAEKNNIVATNYGNVPGIALNDGSGNIVPIQGYYQALGSAEGPADYIYNATNFRLRELSLGYTFRNLFGMNKNLSLSFIGRNLFFFYKDAPTDPDVSLSRTNGLGGFEVFNTPSTRSYGFSVKMNF